MINKIKKVKKLGIFADYQWGNELPEFKKYNLLYGWNGSGKTTLTRLFDILQSGDKGIFKDVEYTIGTTEGDISESTDTDVKIRVFNEDYINANVYLHDCKANPIFILGEENKLLLDKIKTNEDNLITNLDELKDLKQKKTILQKQYDSRFTDIARIISANASGEATRRYDRRNAIEAFDALKSTSELDESEIQKNQTTLKQIEKSLVREIELNFRSDDQTTDSPTSEVILEQSLLDKYFQDAEDLLKEKILSKSIDRVRNNRDISDWVETGLTIHKKHSSQKCEFCANEVSKERLEKLNAHFNNEDKILKSKLNKSISRFSNLINILSNIDIPDKANLYHELQEEYQSKKDQLGTGITNLTQSLKDIVVVLENKKHKVNIKVEAPDKPNFETVQEEVNALNTIISKHNNKTSNFALEKKTAETALEAHYLSTIRDNVVTINQDTENTTKNIERLEKEIKALRITITKDKAKITSPDKACLKLNNNIHQFLGRKDISFEVEGEGYLIKRGDVIATHLSEGEKTAVAFAYFIVHLEDQNFDVSEGIIVIDDPVSSLDSNSIYQAFSFLKTSVRNAKQVFIFTHNFDFLRLLLNWLYPYNKVNTEAYMIKNPTVDTERTAIIDKLDPTLKRHESEYHYLFKKLHDFKSTGEIESVYHIPNIARKVLETFLMFRVPNGHNKHKKLELLKPLFDESKLTSLNKFTNDNSHITGKGFDPSLVPECEKMLNI